MTNVERVRRKARQKLAEQRGIVRSLLKTREQIVGSLFVRYAECGKKDCACSRGKRHGPYYILSTGPGAQGGSAYLDSIQAGRAHRLVRRNREYRNGLRQLRRVNADLVALLRRYRNEMANRGRSMLGLSAARANRKKSLV
ncbi:MAG: hypothetical protein JXO72_10025 [Vicinamibacteria bacterium]|nr:hypothetical protein [Vicinamibacteria bacterium]